MARKKETSILDEVLIILIRIKALKKEIRDLETKKTSLLGDADSNQSVRQFCKYAELNS